MSDNTSGNVDNRIVIVGAGQASGNLVDALRMGGFDGDIGLDDSGEAYARRFLEALKVDSRVEAGAAERAQDDFIRQRLGAEFLFPLLMQ